MAVMKRALLLSCVVACGGGEASTKPVAPTASASSSSTPVAADSQTAAPQDDSPQSIGNRHKKVGSGWFLSGGGKEFYDAIYEPGAEPVVVLKQTTNPGGRWVTLMKNVGAAPYAGKKIRIRIGVKTSGMSSNMTRAEVWARAAVPHQAEDAPSAKVALDHNADMKTYEVTIDVKDDARVVEYGASIAGDGELRVGRDSIDVL
jgi:hypothetical protein